MNYPIHHSPPVQTAFPASGFLGQLESELSSYQVIDPVIIQAVLEQEVTTLTQGVANALWENGLTTSIGSNGVLIGPPTSGKSHLRRCTTPIIEEAIQDVYQIENDAAWPDLYLNDTTCEAIPEAILVWPFRTLVSDEASMQDVLLRTGAKKAALTKYIDCHAYQYARVGRGRKELRNYRLKVFLGIQPDEFEIRKSMFGIGKSGNGFINRFRLAKGGWPVTADQAMRVSLSPATKASLKAKAVELIQLSRKNVGRSEAEWSAIPFHPSAERFFSDWGRQAWSLSQQGSRYQHIPEYLGRSPERIRRWVTSNHVFDHGPEGEVSLSYLEHATARDQQSIELFSQMTYTPPTFTQAEQDSWVLENAIRSYSNSTGEFPKLKELKAYAANYGLTNVRLGRALACLGEQRRAQIMSCNGVDLVVLSHPVISRF